MTEDRKLRLMQDALDEVLTEQSQLELETVLDRDPDEAHRYNKLQRAEILLRSVKHERAPERLALTIMARLGETLMQEAEQENSPFTEASLQMAMTMVTVATLPLMIGASWLLLNAMANPEAFEAILLEVAALFTLMIDVMTIMLEQAQAEFEDNPEAAMALIALMPVALLTLVKQVLGVEEDEGEN